MKKILIIFSLGACTSIQKTTTQQYLLLFNKPIFVSKNVVRWILDFQYYQVVAPRECIVSKSSIYRNSRRETLCIYYQGDRGAFWKLVDSFPLVGNYPQIKKLKDLHMTCS